jgi:hypothetical protein
MKLLALAYMSVGWMPILVLVRRPLTPGIYSGRR